MGETLVEQPSDGQLLELIDKDSLPPCPTVLLAAMEEIRKPAVNFRRLSAVISQDPGLSSAMIRTANSSYFSRRSKTRSVQRALIVLGLETVKEIVTDVALRHTFDVGSAVSMERFWERANYFAKTCCSLAAELTSLPQEEAHTFGLFRDAGIPLLMHRLPNYKDTLRIANEGTGQSFISVEERRHGANHAVVGYRLALKWSLSETVCSAILHHHDASMLVDFEGGIPTEVSNLIALGVLAEHLTNTFLRRPTETEWHKALPIALRHVELSEAEFDGLSQDIFSGLHRRQC